MRDSHVTVTVGALVDRIREKYGPFFVARLGLRVGFSISKAAPSEDPAQVEAILSACRDLGLDTSELIGSAG